MSIAFLVLANLALVTAVLQLGTTLRVRRYYRPIDSDVPAERPPVSVLVPLTGAAAGVEARLERLVAVTRPSDQLLFAVEAEDDPAHAVAVAVRRRHPARDIGIVLSGPAGERLGKQHDLAAAFPCATHALVAFMDDDVELDGPVLDEGARLAGAPGAGAAFALPYRAGRGAVGAAIGGNIVAAYANYGFVPTMASLASHGAPRFIMGSFWVTTRAALDAAGGLEPHTRTVRDDAALGRALRKAGRRNRPLRRPVRLAQEPLGLVDCARQVLSWLTLLRAEGLGVYLWIAWAWNPLALAIAAGLVGWVAPFVADQVAGGLVGAVAATRAGSVLLLNRSVYKALPRTRFVGTTLTYEALLAPALFLIAAFRRHVTRHGRRYRIGPGGTIVGT
jgi:cellulose synthase/poly-beta-1,6-N-acetylglucosamine synthase-like glycosyltransferase